MNRSTFSKELASKFGISNKQAYDLIKEIFDAVHAEAVSTGLSQVRGFGTFSVVNRSERRAPIPGKGKGTRLVPAHQRLIFSERLDAMLATPDMRDKHTED